MAVSASQLHEPHALPLGCLVVKDSAAPLSAARTCEYWGRKPKRSRLLRLRYLKDKPWSTRLPRVGMLEENTAEPKPPAVTIPRGRGYLEEGEKHRGAHNPHGDTPWKTPWSSSVASAQEMLLQSILPAVVLTTQPSTSPKVVGSWGPKLPRA